MKYFIITLLFISSNTAKAITYGEILDIWIEGVANLQDIKITYAQNMLLDAAPNRKSCDDTLSSVYRTLINEQNLLIAKKQWSPINYEKMARKILNENKEIIQLSCWHINSK